MRRSLRAIHRSPIGNAAKVLSLTPSPAFSTAAGGRGRGRGSPSVSDPAPPGKPAGEDDLPAAIPGLGHGRGKSQTPLPTRPTVAPFAAAGRGQAPSGQHGAETGRKLPIFFTKNDPKPVAPDQAQAQAQAQARVGDVATEKDLHLGIVSALSGAGRGKITKEQIPEPQPVNEVKVENRHIRPRQTVKLDEQSGTLKLSNEDAVKKAMGILSKGDGAGAGAGDEERRMENSGGRGGRGGYRGRGGFRGRGRGGRGRWDGGRGRGRGGRDAQDKDDDFGAGLYLGDEADGEKLAKKLGPEKMDMLAEAFEEMSSRVLPSPAEDAYIDALHTNLLFECEPEYMMEEFGVNPDIDDTPPIPLRDALEKIKPFLMAYENIQSHEEWEKIMEETMKTVPLMKEIVDHYSGPNRVTAKQQQQELQRVANTLPDNAHASVKRFTDRAILSLQSNPGWGFDKKCQFMDKLAWEVTQYYK